MTTAIRRPTGASTSQELSGGRLDFVDVLRVFLIALVIAHHAGQPYGPTGGAWPVEDPANFDLLGDFFWVNASFFMGLLFLLAGYFVPRSYDRKGTRQFLRGRWQRLGIPLVFFGVFIHLPVYYLVGASGESLGDFLRLVYAENLQPLYIHLWFLAHLLVYSSVYVAWRMIADRRGRTIREWNVPSHTAILGFVLVLALVTWIVRFWFGIDQWVPLVWLVAAEPAHLPQYVSLFVVGIVAYRGDWFRRLSTRTGMIWLGTGLVSSVGITAWRQLATRNYDEVIGVGSPTSWQKLFEVTVESLICVGMSVGLIVLFRLGFRKANRLLAAMAATSYAAYILHWMIVFGLQTAILDVGLPAVVKFGLVTVLGGILAFGLGHLSRRIPGLRAVLGTRPDMPRRSDARSEARS